MVGGCPACEAWGRDFCIKNLSVADQSVPCCSGCSARCTGCLMCDEDQSWESFQYLVKLECHFSWQGQHSARNVVFLHTKCVAQDGFLASSPKPRVRMQTFGQDLINHSISLVMCFQVVQKRIWIFCVHECMMWKTPPKPYLEFGQLPYLFVLRLCCLIGFSWLSTCSRSFLRNLSW